MAQAPYGQQAREALQNWLPVGSTVTLRVQTTDRYGRAVAEVFTPNVSNIGLSLVQQGHAFAYRQYLSPCDAWTYLDRERVAQLYRTGVWRSDGGGIQRPWDWRAANKDVPRRPSMRPVTLTILNDRAAPASSPGRRWYCENVGSWERAQQLLREGHMYLDGDSDGEACEGLR